MFGKLKDWRRIHTRYDRCAHTFMSAIAIAATVIFWIYLMSPEPSTVLARHLAKFVSAIDNILQGILKLKIQNRQQYLVQKFFGEFVQLIRQKRSCFRPA